MYIPPADAWEALARAYPDKVAIIDDQRHITWQSFEDRAARLAQYLTAQGLKPGSKFAMYCRNRGEYLEAQFAAFKARLVLINVNYRYLNKELSHIINNSDSEALIVQGDYLPRVADIRDDLPQVRSILHINDGTGNTLEGSVDIEEAIASQEPMPVIERSGDDHYMIYTGGTTGLPKGVVHEIGPFWNSLLGVASRSRDETLPTSADEFPDYVQRIAAKGQTPVTITACPIMHGTGMWLGAFVSLSLGGTCVLFDHGKFDPAILWKLVEDTKTTDIVIVGDVFARPMLNELDAAAERGTPYDVSSLKFIRSSGVMWSIEVKRGLLKHADVTLVDSMGSSESAYGISEMNRANIDVSDTGQFKLHPTTHVLDDNGKQVEPGSGDIGLICAAGLVPLNYYKDPEKSAKTFQVINGVRYCVPGDYATVEADGAIKLIGRGSTCINTGGEKVFPEEVEEAVKTFPGVLDCLVVGIPDTRFGERVTALYASASEASVTEDLLRTHVREQLAGYKTPKNFVQTRAMPRAANGKPDYKAARAMVLEQVGSESVNR